MPPNWACVELPLMHMVVILISTLGDRSWDLKDSLVV